MEQIHPTAIIEEGAQIHPSSSVGAFSIIESGAVIGSECIIESCVRIFSAVRMGNNNHVFHGVVLGCEPQDLGYTTEKSKPLTIGSGNMFKEGVNISRGVKTANGSIIGDRNYFMCGVHVGHDCHINDNIVISANSVIGGHVSISEYTFISGLVAVHQFVNIGQYTMLSGCSKVVKDIPPFTTADGNPARIVGFNNVGMKRAGFSSAARKRIKQCYHTLFHAGLNITQALEQLNSGTLSAEDVSIVDFFENSERGVTTHR